MGLGMKMGPRGADRTGDANQGWGGSCAGLSAGQLTCTAQPPHPWGGTVVWVLRGRMGNHQPTLSCHPGKHFLSKAGLPLPHLEEELSS